MLEPDGVDQYPVATVLHKARGVGCPLLVTRQQAIAGELKPVVAIRDTERSGHPVQVLTDGILIDDGKTKPVIGGCSGQIGFADAQPVVQRTVDSPIDSQLVVHRPQCQRCSLNGDRVVHDGARAERGR